MAWAVCVAAEEEVLVGQKSTERRETDTKENRVSMRRREDEGDTIKCTHCLLFPGDAGAKVTSPAMSAQVATWRTGSGTQTLSVYLSPYEKMVKGPCQRHFLTFNELAIREC